MKKMLVTGSRKWQYMPAIMHAMKEHGPHQLIHGGAGGADTIAHTCALVMRWPDPIVVKPKYHLYKNKKVAPLMRNQEMVDMLEPGDVVLAFVKDESRGTKDCINRAVEAGFDVRIYQDNGWVPESGLTG